jgi:hypothetical protein
MEVARILRREPDGRNDNVVLVGMAVPVALLTNDDAFVQRASSAYDWAWLRDVGVRNSEQEHVFRDRARLPDQEPASTGLSALSVFLALIEVDNGLQQSIFNARHRLTPRT